MDDICCSELVTLQLYIQEGEGRKRDDQKGWVGAESITGELLPPEIYAFADHNSVSDVKDTVGPFFFKYDGPADGPCCRAPIVRER